MVGVPGATYWRSRGVLGRLREGIVAGATYWRSSGVLGRLREGFVAGATYWRSSGVLGRLLGAGVPAGCLAIREDSATEILFLRLLRRQL